MGEPLVLLKIKSMDDEQIGQLLFEGKMSMSELEKMFASDPARAVLIRRRFVFRKTGVSLDVIPSVDCECLTMRRGCENMIGYVPIPLGVVGPLVVCGLQYWVPMATTEGALIASVQRGSKAIFESGGSIAFVYSDKMTRGPVLSFTCLREAITFFEWAQDEKMVEEISEIFDSTSRFVRLKRVIPTISGSDVFLRFEASTGDAMGMNMVSKATQKVLEHIRGRFPGIQRMGLSGNYCVDKKPSSLNWILGRGKSVVAEVVLKKEVVERILHCRIVDLEEMNRLKNVKGSSMAGCEGNGFNAQASNVVTAIYVATGQDPAQNVVSSGCMTEMRVLEGRGLQITCTMPCVEVGTVGGGTGLPVQSECLRMMGIGGSVPGKIGENAKVLAKIVCVAVMAGEISLLSSICEGTLASAHMRLGRSQET